MTPIVSHIKGHPGDARIPNERFLRFAQLFRSTFTRYIRWTIIKQIFLLFSNLFCVDNTVLQMANSILRLSDVNFATVNALHVYIIISSNKEDNF